ncbi:hypothetical protein EI94DRAFT_1774119 [Lactarius quietus]|nr:hypothetical protein EI94DRAFT_1774119 [Lactarius quietus]
MAAYLYMPSPPFRFLRDPVSQPPTPDLSEASSNPWLPFDGRLEYEWVHYHYIRLQSLANDIQHGLDLWRATVAKHQTEDNDYDGVPWKNTKDMYNTIDSIAAGGVGWKTYQFSYNRPKPTRTLPQWMQDTYELNVRDVLSIFEEQLASKEFDGQFDYVPYEEYNKNGSHIYSNLMSGTWASRQADMISQDENLLGSMFVPIVASSDKTTVSVATGSQEYYPVYASLGNITNTACHAHGNGVVPIAFLLILKVFKRASTSKNDQNTKSFVRQLYHSCLALVFQPLKPYMMSPIVLKCLDGHFHRTIFGLGPYIANYPEQVWLSGIVSNWCPKCDALPSDLDGPESHQCSHEKTDLLINTFDHNVLWDNFGIRHNIVPYTHSFPHADIHELLAPDLLHQLIKGVFKDHIIEWVLAYVHKTHGGNSALDIIEDIDQWISAVPIFPGLCWFADGHDFKQWMGNDSKALMKVFLAAIASYVPLAMVRSVAAFMDACYIAQCVETYCKLCVIFVETGVCSLLSMPRQHALKHFHHAIHLFGSPNGLCSSIMESKHIKSVKDTWRQSSRYHALAQMLRTLKHMDKMMALHQHLEAGGFLQGFGFPFPSNCVDTSNHASNVPTLEESEEPEDGDAIRILGNTQDVSEFDIRLATRPHTSDYSLFWLSECGYPPGLLALAVHIKQPNFPLVFTQFLSKTLHPDKPTMLEECPTFDGAIKVHHSATATFYAPSDLSGSGGLWRELIQSTPSFYGHPHHDTVFVVTDDSHPGMDGMEIGRVLLFFSFKYQRKRLACA